MKLNKNKIILIASLLILLLGGGFIYKRYFANRAAGTWTNVNFDGTQVGFATATIDDDNENFSITAVIEGPDGDLIDTEIMNGKVDVEHGRLITQQYYASLDEDSVGLFPIEKIIKAHNQTLKNNGASGKIYEANKASKDSFIFNYRKKGGKLQIKFSGQNAKEDVWETFKKD